MNAIVLAAGNGDRFRTPAGESKLLHPFLGRPLLLRTLECARDGGIDRVTIVLGYQADRVRALVEHGAPAGVLVSYVVNTDWHLENGLSVLAGQAAVGSARFAILMGDHIFEPAALWQLLQYPIGEDESVLAVDARPVAPHLAAEATKVRRDGSRIVAIGKTLSDYDAIDTGMFVCSSNLFGALETARSSGDTTLSGAIRLLARRGQMRALEIGDALWRDIDTVSDLEAAESAVATRDSA